MKQEREMIIKMEKREKEIRIEMKIINVNYFIINSEYKVDILVHSLSGGLLV